MQMSISCYNILPTKGIMHFLAHLVVDIENGAPAATECLFNLCLVKLHSHKSNILCLFLCMYHFDFIFSNIITIGHTVMYCCVFVRPKAR